MENIDLYIVFTTALIASFGHCVGMCGGIVVAYSSAKIDNRDKLLKRNISHIIYSLGRVTTYTIIGAIFGAIGRVIAFTPTTKGVLFLLTGVLMILAGLSLIGGIKFLTSVEFSISQNRWYANIFRRVIASKSIFSFYILGVLNGIIPCGLVLSFAVFAASSASIIDGATIMLIFGLATIPAMFILASITNILQKGKLRNIMLKIASILVIAYGVYTVYKGYLFVTNPIETQREIDKMNEGSIRSKVNGKCGGMKCEAGKCG
ncbi:membrane protein, putative [hydrothermal vent metagenome]|uniref:Membrane protein, putative n=1 Tax=hydrothermal vent metagenome TaxID=652676 RepID=A0A1W1EK21_9ZZZZ